MFPQPVHSWTNAGGVAENSPARKGWKKAPLTTFPFGGFFAEPSFFRPS